MVMMLDQLGDGDLGGVGSIPGDFGAGTGTGTGTGTGSGTGTGTAPGTGTPLALKVIFFRVGFDAEAIRVDRWSYNGPLSRPELAPLANWQGAGVFHLIPDGVVCLDLAQGEVIRWAESDDPAALVSTMSTESAEEDRHEADPGARMTRRAMEPRARYLRAVIIGPAAGIVSRIRALGDYEHTPATMLPGRLFQVPA